MKNTETSRKPRKGQGIVEYALIIIAVVAIMLYVVFKKNSTASRAVNTAYSKLVNKVNLIPTRISASSSPGGGGAD